MLGIDATFGDVLPDQGRDSRQALLRIVPGAAALALAGCLGVWVLHARQAAAPERVVAGPASAPVAAPVKEIASKPFGDIIVDPSFVAELNAAARAGDGSQSASLEATQPAPLAATPQAETVPPASAAIPLPDVIPLPPPRDVPQIADEAPLPPPRPPELGLNPAPPAPDNHLAQQTRRPAGPPAPVDNRNIFEKLLGLGQPSAPTVAGKAPESRVASVAPEAHATFTAPEGRVTGRPLFSFFGPATGPVAGYDQWTAVYDISARTVYLPDGTRLEAHSGYGDKLDDPRYVSERMRGATPPNVYALEPREGSFHGVQALRLTPVGDGPLFGRAGLLAHPYMLGPDGQSNGCVSFKDYDAFLRAYQSGQVKKLVVVSRL
jgi:Protein of unknown function (DUF2778)